ncbi:hypothetical protein F5Y10DRAFT_246433 [Nemania abortiva]|nr:hypothetical protein F5Y10DRAFT_246433 [Nemania abortiva]
MSNATRFAELRQLVLGGDGLSRDEIRYLRLLLPDVHTDPVDELPLEIVIMIVLQLQDLRDFARCLCVSKVWRRRLLSDAVMTAYAKRRWPALIDGAVNRRDFLGTLWKFGWVFDTSPGRVEMESVAWDGTTHYQLDPVFHDRLDDLPTAYTQHPRQNPREPDSPPINGSALYFSGKVAWRFNGCLVIIDDLRSKTRKIFTLPSGVRHGLVLRLHALGSRLIVATLDRLVIAWDHVDNRAYEKSIPCSAYWCTTQDNRVAIVTYDRDVMIWTPGHALVQVNASPLILEADCVSVFFDARNSKTLYLVSAYCFLLDAKSMVRTTVHEFSVTGHVASWSSENEDPAANLDSGGLNFRYTTGYRPEERVLIAEYELDRSYILFFRRTPGSGGLRFAVFDKLERRFIDPELPDCWCLGSDYTSVTVNDPKSRIRGRADLDFKVIADLDAYEVKRTPKLQNQAQLA